MNPITFFVDSLFLPFLTFSYNTIYPNYGIAIILLTVLIKLIFFPITKKQFVSMQATQKLQPELKRIQEKLKGQPDKLHKEMMKLWKENNVNPLSGCLPMLIQMPVFLGIFYTVKSDMFINLISAPGVNPGLFSFWLSNLGQPDPFYLLPVIIALSTYWSQKAMMKEPSQKPLLIFMPIIMLVFCVNMPSGVLLYWASSQLISMVQQKMVMKNNI